MSVPITEVTSGVRGMTGTRGAAVTGRLAGTAARAAATAADMTAHRRAEGTLIAEEGTMMRLRAVVAADTAAATMTAATAATGAALWQI